jgi:ABC-2 type transport system permease protein
MMSTVAYITARGLFGRRRALLLLPLPILLIGLALLCRGFDVDPNQWGGNVIGDLGLGVVLPVLALIVGTGVLGSEIDDGTIVHILTKPLARRDIVLAKLLVSTVVTALTAGIPLFVAGLLASSTRFALALAAAAAVGALAYSALFLLMSLLSRRPVLVGLAYILVWENLLGRFLTGSKVLSIHQYTVALADHISPSAILSGQVSVMLAAIMSAIFAVLGTLYAINRLGAFSMAGETS